MVTMDGEQGVRMMKVIDPKTAIPIHYDDYDVFTSPLSDFLKEAEKAGLADRVHVLRRGETVEFSQLAL
jgi:L-ascorbate metabolism protein UlaG (beta-lactamase superfamily)